MDVTLKLLGDPDNPAAQRLQIKRSCVDKQDIAILIGLVAIILTVELALVGMLITILLAR